MPFSTKSFELKYPKVNIPKDSVRTITIPDGTSPPSTQSHADFVSRFNPTGNSELADVPRRVIDTQADQRYVLMYFMYFAVSIYAQLDVKSHPTITPASLVSYFLTLYHAFHLVNDKYYRGRQSRHADHFLSDDTRRDFFFSLTKLAVPPQIESFLRLSLPSSDPRRPEMRFVPTYAAFSFQNDYGRFIPASFMITAHNVLASVQANTNPNFVLHHWFLQSLATYESAPHVTSEILSVGNFIGYHIPQPANVPSYPNTWFSNAITDLITPIVARTIAQRFVFSQVPFTAIDLSNPDNLSLGFDGSVNTGYDAHDINPYILGLSADLENIDATINFVETMSRNLEDAHLASVSLGSICSEDSNVHIFSHAYISPSLPTHSVFHNATITKPRTTIPTTMAEMVTPTTYARTIHFLNTRTFTPSTRSIDLVYPTVGQGWKDANDAPVTGLAFAAHRWLLVTSADSTNAQAPTPESDKYVTYNQRVHYTPRIRILNPFDANPSESHVSQITGRIIESAEIDATSIRYPDSRLLLSHENSFFLQSSLPIRYIHPATDLNVSILDRRLPDQDEEPVSLSMYDASLNRFGRLVLDHQSETNFDHTAAPHGFHTVNFTRFTDLVSNKIAMRTSQVGHSAANVTSPNISPEYVYAWSPYRFVQPNRVSNPLDAILFITEQRSYYGTSTPLMAADHPSVHFPKN